MRHFDEYHYLIVNDDFATVLDQLAALFCAGRLRCEPQSQRYAVELKGLLEPAD